MFIIGPLYFLRFSAAAFSLARSLPTRLIGLVLGVVALSGAK
jgi:hypothetical protein